MRFMEYRKPSDQTIVKSRLGRLLLKKGMINRQQLDQALRLQSESGRLLGEILLHQGWVSERQLSRALKRQSRYRLITAFLAVLMGPMSLGAFASTSDKTQNEPVNTSIAHKDAGSDLYTSMTALDDEALANISGQGQTDLSTALENLIAESKGEREDDLGPLNEITTLLNPLTQMLDADVTVKGVKYDHGKPRTSVNSDGSVDMALPSEIEEIAFRNMRVKGDQSGASFGDVIITGVRFSPESNVNIRVHE